MHISESLTHVLLGWMKRHVHLHYDQRRRVSGIHRTFAADVELPGGRPSADRCEAETPEHAGFLEDRRIGDWDDGELPEQQMRVLELADEFMKAGRYSTAPAGQDAWSKVVNASIKMTRIVTIALTIVGIGAVVARGCLTERDRQ